MELLLVLILVLNFNVCKCEKPCDDKPCQNGGTCNKAKAGSYHCLCSAGFTGKNCETGAEHTTPTASTTETSTLTTVSTTETSILTTVSTAETSTLTTVSTTETSALTTVSTTESSASISTVSTIETSASTESVKSFESLPTATAKRQGDKTTIVVSVIIPVVVVVICAVILGVFLIRRWKRRKRLGTTAKERAPGISISNTSYGDHQVNISKISENRDASDVADNEHAEIVANGNAVNEQPDGYYTINDVPKISQTNNTNYAHINAHKALLLDSNYTHIENKNKKVSKTGDYGFSNIKRSIFQLKKSSKKDAGSSYDNLEMKTVACDPNKNFADVSVTEIESAYNHTHSGVPESIRKDKQNEKDEYSHLDHMPKSMKAHANEVTTENPYRREQSQLTSELLANLRANEYENAVGIRNDYFVLEPVGESVDHSIEESDMSKSEEKNSISASGFQYEYAREVERSGTHKNEETRDIQSACHYELSKDIDKNIDIASTPADVDDRLGTNSATDDENQNHHYFILSKT